MKRNVPHHHFLTQRKRFLLSSILILMSISFQGIDFKNLRSTRAEFIPRVDHAEDTSNFEAVEVSQGDFASLHSPGFNNSKKFNLVQINESPFETLGKRAPNNPAFYEFTFRHFFDTDGQGCPSLRPAQKRPPLAPLFEGTARHETVSSSESIVIQRGFTQLSRAVLTGGHIHCWVARDVLKGRWCFRPWTEEDEVLRTFLQYCCDGATRQQSQVAVTYGQTEWFTPVLFFPLVSLLRWPVLVSILSIFSYLLSRSVVTERRRHPYIISNRSWFTRPKIPCQKGSTCPHSSSVHYNVRFLVRISVISDERLFELFLPPYLSSFRLR